MSGTTTSKVRVTLRNPLDFNDQVSYTITPLDNALAVDWVDALRKLLQSKNLLEKNYCFMGFPNTARNLDYLCGQLNQSVRQINTFNSTQQWQKGGLESYVIEDYFTPDTVRFNDDYPIGYDDSALGLSIKHTVMNRLHNHFERLQGTVWELSDYYKIADYETKYAIRQLNNICHEIETLVLSQRKAATLPYWVRPSQITTFLHAERYELKDEHREIFNSNGYDRKFGQVYMHWTQIGKTLIEVFRDEGAPDLDDTVCEAINSLKYYSGEFDVEWGNDVIEGDPAIPWHTKELATFREWLVKNGLDPKDPKLSLGYLPIGQVDLKESFGTKDSEKIWQILGAHLDIVKIEVEDISNRFDYCWSDPTYKQEQINMMKPGYDFSSGW